MYEISLRLKSGEHFVLRIIIVIGDLVDRMASHQGHIMVRVYPGGNKYRMSVFDDAVPISESHVIYESDLFECMK